MTSLPVADAARALGVRPGTLRRWIREGCPIASHGRRGRGHAVLIDPDAARAWRDADQRAQAMLELAAEIPRLLAIAIEEAHQQAKGIDKKPLAGILAATWLTSAVAVLDHLREQCADVPQISPAAPEQIDRLVKIARG